MKTCIATVTSPDFVPGTLVLIHTFLKHNPWFDGDIVLITDGLSPREENELSNFPNVSFHKPGNDLQLRIGSLCMDLPTYNPKRKRFYSIEVFNLQDYDRVLFFDSDMLVTSDLSEIAKLPDQLMACSDMFNHPGRVRDKLTFKRKPELDFLDKQSFLPTTFNAGFISIGSNYLNGNTYKGLKELINKDIFEKIRTHNTDQVVFNLYFDGKTTLLPIAYNLIMSKWPALLQSEKITSNEIKILHYTGNYKPWETSPKMNELMADTHFKPFYDLWHSEYQEALSRLNKKN